MCADWMLSRITCLCSTWLCSTNAASENGVALLVVRNTAVPGTRGTASLHRPARNSWMLPADSAILRPT